MSNFAFSTLQDFFIMDGHGSRAGDDFLSYINDETHKWHLMLGVPYASDKWQMHYDTRMNVRLGCWDDVFFNIISFNTIES